MIDGIHLRVEIVDDVEQYDTNNLYDSSRLGTSAKRKDEAEKIANMAAWLMQEVMKNNHPSKSINPSIEESVM